MSFREKTAWAMLLILIVASANYTFRVFDASQALGASAPPIIHWVVAYIVFIILATIAVMIPLSIATPEEADAPADEREREIQHKAGDYSGYVLGAGAVIAMLHYVFNQDGNLMFHIVLASLMLSQISEYALQIVYFRSGN